MTGFYRRPSTTPRRPFSASTATSPIGQLGHPAVLPNHVWAGDITYLKVGAIYRYLAVVLDRCSRAVVGWSFGHRKDVALTLRALDRAVANPGRRMA